MTTDAVRPEGFETPVSSSVPIPLDPEVMAGPLWLRGPRSGEPAADEPAEIEQSTPAPDAAPTPADVGETATRAVLQIDAAISSLQAMRSQLLAGLGTMAIEDARAERLDPGVGLRDAANELALQQRRSDRTVEAELNASMRQRECWPQSMRAWGEARIHRGHLAVIAEIGAPLQGAEQRSAFEQALLPHAERTTPGRLRAIARRELERLLDEPLAARHTAARARRGVFRKDLDDGMSLIEAFVPTLFAHGIDDRLTQMARAGAPGDGVDPRTFDERRADALCDLLLTGEPTGTAIEGIRAQVSVVIPAPILTGTVECVRGSDGTDADEDAIEGVIADDDGDGTDDDAAGADVADGDADVADEDVDGTDDGAAGADDTDASTDRDAARLSTGAPVDPETARLLAERAKAWTRLFTDPLKGHVTAVDTYQPSRRLKRLLRARDQHCRWPGCTARAIRCDIDHTKPWSEGGKTEAGNLGHLCRRHHTLKSAQLSRARRWKVRQLSPGVFEFVSPDGHRYVEDPPSVGPTFRKPDESWGWRMGPLTRREAEAPARSYPY